MHVITIATTFAATVDVLLALGVHEICHWGKHCVDFLAGEKSSVDVLLSILCIIFVRILDIDVSDQMVAKIIDYNHIFNLTILAHFLKNIFVKLLKPWVK